MELDSLLPQPLVLVMVPELESLPPQPSVLVMVPQLESPLPQHTHMVDTLDHLLVSFPSLPILMELLFPQTNQPYLLQELNI